MGILKKQKNKGEREDLPPHFSALFFVAVSLGLAWAMRGHFGHEWGASWAGAVGVLALVLVTGRRDWARKAPVLAVLGATGWGAGGMMSYGQVVGYCRSLSFPDALYGYTMLTVIGALYGFTGGGLTGLGLEEEEKKKADWARLMAEMVAGAILAWGLLVYQMEWLMTPPRSELWAAMLGAAGALAWYLGRNGYHRALRTAAYSALGAGFGFSFGNLIQTLGSTSGLHYNWWNVMEFSLGFFGGLGMMWGVLTTSWPVSRPAGTTGNGIAAFLLFLFIPFTNLVNAMGSARFMERATRLKLDVSPSFGTHQMWAAAGVMLLFAILLMLAWRRWGGDEAQARRRAVPALFFLITLEYNLFAYLQLLFFRQPFSMGRSETLYIFILAALFFWWYAELRRKNAPPVDGGIQETPQRWTTILLLLVLVLLVLTFISVHAHGPLPGAHERFRP